MKSIQRNLAYLAVIFIFASGILFVAHLTESKAKAGIEANGSHPWAAIHSEEFPYEIGSTHSFKNLQLIFLSTESNIIDKDYITLSEAMNNKYVTVFETEDVNQLSVENTSNHYVFICSGEIVKGGKQDRTIGIDIIVPPKSGKIPLASFCVESGRWQQREGEALLEFNSSDYSLSSRDLKIAAKKSKNQSEVWGSVTRQQTKVNENMVAYYDYEESYDVKDDKSETSLQLTLENKELQNVKAEYERFFKDLNYDKSQTLGFAYAINGEIYGIDIYHNYQLFNDLWQKNLDAIIVEAISELNNEENKTMSKADILALMYDFSNAKAVAEKVEVNSETTYITVTTANLVKFETLDKRENNNTLHLNYITVDTNKTAIGLENRLNFEEENIQIQQNRIFE